MTGSDKMWHSHYGMLLPQSQTAKVQTMNKMNKILTASKYCFEKYFVSYLKLDDHENTAKYSKIQDSF